MRELRPRLRLSAFLRMRPASDLGRPLPALLSLIFKACGLRFSDCLQAIEVELGGNPETGGEVCGFDDTRQHVLLSPNPQLEDIEIKRKSKKFGLKDFDY